MTKTVISLNVRRCTEYMPEISRLKERGVFVMQNNWTIPILKTWIINFSSFWAFIGTSDCITSKGCENFSTLQTRCRIYSNNVEIFPLSHFLFAYVYIYIYMYTRWYSPSLFMLYSRSRNINKILISGSVDRKRERI